MGNITMKIMQKLSAQTKLIALKLEFFHGRLAEENISWGLEVQKEKDPTNTHLCEKAWMHLLKWLVHGKIISINKSCGNYALQLPIESCFKIIQFKQSLLREKAKPNQGHRPL